MVALKFEFPECCIQWGTITSRAKYISVMYVTFFVKYWQIIQKVILIFILTSLPHINVSTVLWAHAPNCDANDVRVRYAFEKQAGFI